MAFFLISHSPISRDRPGWVTKISKWSERHENFNHQGNFHCRFRIWPKNWLKLCNSTREHRFVHFRHSREDLSNQSQTLPEYRERHPHQKTRTKIGNIYGHLAKIAIWNLKNCQNLKNCENFKSVVETWNFFSRVIFIIDSEYELKFDINFAISPVRALSSNFGDFARTYPITLKLDKNIEYDPYQNLRKKLAILR